MYMIMWYFCVEKMHTKLLSYNTENNKSIFVEMNSLMLNFCWLPTDVQSALQNSKGISWIVEDMRRKRMSQP